MPRAILDAGLADLRNAVKARWTHLGVATDTTAFAAGQTALDPANVGATNLLIKPATWTDVDGTTADATITVNGTSELTGRTLFTEGLLTSSARTAAVARVVRPVGIGVAAGDTFTIGLRVKVTDAT
ncbi:MAG TPA: hypothetical protein VNT51_00395 [Miltoncostaeaceae bacterium]|nr:hypothetical protein [Miltoncostaeaceae bacterium]